MPKNRTKKVPLLTPIMEKFVAERVREGFALSREEFIRFLVGQEIKEWEEVRKYPYR